MCNTIMYDNGTGVGVGNTNPGYIFDISGRTRIRTGGGSAGIWYMNNANSSNIGFIGVYDDTHLGLYGSAYGWGEVMDVGTGYVGIGTVTPAYRLHVVENALNQTAVWADNTNTGSGTTNFGVRGSTSSTGIGSAGVWGYSDNSSYNEVGVKGSYSLWGAAIFGQGWAGSASPGNTLDYGVFGTVDYHTGHGGYFENLSTGGGYGLEAKAPSPTYALYSTGNFAASGTKSASVPTSKGNQLLYCTESPEIWFEDIGIGKLTNGEVTINLDPLFLQTVVIDEEHPMVVFLQENGDSKGLYVEPGQTSFTVKEKSGGTSDVSFSYKVMAHRVHYQDFRFGFDPKWGDTDTRPQFKDETVRPIEPTDYYKLYGPQIEREKASKAKYLLEHPTRH